MTLSFCLMTPEVVQSILPASAPNRNPRFESITCIPSSGIEAHRFLDPSKGSFIAPKAYLNLENSF